MGQPASSRACTKKTPAKSSADASHDTTYLVTIQPNQHMAEL